MKHIYKVPSIKVVSFKVEDIFLSPTPETKDLNIGNQNTTPVKEGSEAFGFGSIFRD